MFDYIAQDVEGYAIQSLGVTPEDALLQAIEDTGPHYDADEKQLSFEEAAKKFAVYPCSFDLAQQVQQQGGGISWAIVDGVAVTIGEAESGAL